MTSLTGKRKFYPGDRLFQLAEYLSIYLDIETHAFYAWQKVPPKSGHNWYATLVGKQFPVNVRHPVFGPYPLSFQTAKKIRSY